MNGSPGEKLLVIADQVPQSQQGFLKTKTLLYLPKGEALRD